MLRFKFFDQVIALSPAELTEKVYRLEEYYDLDLRDGDIFLRNNSLRPPFWTCTFRIVEESSGRARLLAYVVPNSVPGAVAILAVPPFLLASAVVRPEQRGLALLVLGVVMVFIGLDMALLIWSFRKWLKKKVCA